MLKRVLSSVVSLLLVAGFITLLTQPARAEITSAGVEQVIPLGSTTRPTRHATLNRRSDATLLYRGENIAFSALGVTWRSAEAHAEVQFRYRHRDVWVPWSSTHAHASTAEGRGGTQMLWTPNATAVEVRVAEEEDTELRDVRVHLFDPSGNPREDLPDVELKRGTYGATLEYYNRAQWGADESLMTWTPRHIPEVRAITVHHTVSRNNYTRDEVPAMMRSIYRFHAVSRGWGDIGYHLVVDRFGRAWEGRAGGLGDLIQGGHAYGFNGMTAGVSVLGTFTNTALPAAARETLSTFAAYKLAASGVHPNSTVDVTGGPGGKFDKRVTISTPAIFGHNTVNNTACPGNGVEAEFNTIRARSGEIYDTGGVGLRLAGQEDV